LFTLHALTRTAKRRRRTHPRSAAIRAIPRGFGKDLPIAII